MAWHLAQQGLRFVVLEAGPELGHIWRSRWDSLKLFTPAQYDALPGMAFPAPADTYPTKDPVADYLQAYAAAFDLPVRLNARVTGLQADRRRLRGPHRRRHLPGPAGGGGHRPVPGPLRPTAGRGSRPLGDPGPQRRLPQPPGPARRAGAGGRRGELGVPDRRGAGRHPHGRPVDRHHLSDAAPAAGRPGPVLVADPPGPAAGHGHLPAGPADEPPGLRDRDQPEEAGAGRGAVPAAAGRRRGPHGPLRRPPPPGGRRGGGVGDRLSPRLRLDPHPRGGP